MRIERLSSPRRRLICSSSSPAGTVIFNSRFSPSALVSVTFIAECSYQEVNSGPGWCGRGDLNPHDLHRWNLNPVRLPIPPRPRGHPFVAGVINIVIRPNIGEPPPGLL